MNSKKELGRILLFSVLLFSAVIGVSCATNASLVNGQSQEGDELELPQFTSIDVRSNWRVHLVQGNVQSVRIDVPSEYKDKIIVQVRRGRLVLSVKNGFWGRVLTGDKKLTAHIVVPSLNEIRMKGASRMDITDMFNNRKDLSIYIDMASRLNADGIMCPNLRSEVRGASRMDIESLKVGVMAVKLAGASRLNLGTIGAKEVAMEVYGASRVAATGHTTAINAQLYGASSLKAEALECYVAKLHVVGASHMELYVAKSAKAYARGASKVIIFGKPKEVDADSAGVSSIQY